MSKTLAPKCLLCDCAAAAIIYYPKGCTCLDNQYQPRCMQHVMRADDSCEKPSYVVESFHSEIAVELSAGQQAADIKLLREACQFAAEPTNGTNETIAKCREALAATDPNREME